MLFHKTNKITVFALACFVLSAATCAAETVDLNYVFQDFHGKKRSVDFSLTTSDIKDSVKEYGVPKEEMGPQEVTLSYRYTYPAKASPETISKIKAKAKAESEIKVKAMLESRRQKLISKGYCFVDKDKVGVDLSAAWKRNLKRMSVYAGQFRKQVRARSEREYSDQALAFVQQMKYATPPDERAGQCILQFFPPVETLNAGYGDCDTKVVLFASLVDNGTGPEVVALRGPDHVLAGVECSPDTAGCIIEAFGKNFLVCECSAPTWPAGSISEKIFLSLKKGEYEVVRLRQ